MEIRKADAQDLQTILEIYAHARRFMAEHGNPTQWGSDRPPRSQTEDDIRRGRLYVCEAEGRIACVFYFAQEEDPTYRVIEDGAWLADGPYGVVHRIASVPGTRGAATYCLNWAFARCGNLRIDTHADNAPMQGLLRKLGFARCGRIYIADGSPREAFQKAR